MLRVGIKLMNCFIPVQCSGLSCVVWFRCTGALKFGPDVGTSWCKQCGAKAAGMQEFEHELQTEDIPMNGFSNKFWLQIPGVHLLLGKSSAADNCCSQLSLQQWQETLQDRVKVQALAGSFLAVALNVPVLRIRGFALLWCLAKGTFTVLWKRAMLKGKAGGSLHKVV